jgi:hypothetical protein
VKPAPGLIRADGTLPRPWRGVVPAAMPPRRRLGAKAAIETPEQFSAFIAAEYGKWKGISDASGIKVDLPIDCRSVRLP